MPRRHRPGTPPTPHTNTTKTWARHPNHHRILTKYYGRTTKQPPRHQGPPKHKWKTTKTPARQTPRKNAANMLRCNHFWPSIFSLHNHHHRHNNLITTTPPSFRLSLVVFFIFSHQPCPHHHHQYQQHPFHHHHQEHLFSRNSLVILFQPVSRCRWASPAPTHLPTVIALRNCHCERIFFNTYMFTFIHALGQVLWCNFIKRKTLCSYHMNICWGLRQAHGRRRRCFQKTQRNWYIPVANVKMRWKSFFYCKHAHNFTICFSLFSWCGLRWWQRNENPGAKCGPPGNHSKNTNRVNKYRNCCQMK